MRNRVWTVAVALALATSWAADKGVRAEVVGGTLDGLPKKADARLDFMSADDLAVRCGKSEVRIPYNSIQVVEYGQRVGRRYAAAILISPVFLLSKARKHYLTIEFQGRDGKQQALVFRVDKNDIRPALASIEARTGRRIEYQDDEARKTGR